MMPRAIFLPRTKWQPPLDTLPPSRVFVQLLWAVAALLYVGLVLVIAFTIPLPEKPAPAPSVEINARPGLERSQSR